MSPQGRHSMCILKEQPMTVAFSASPTHPFNHHTTVWLLSDQWGGGECPFWAATTPWHLLSPESPTSSQTAPQPDFG